MSASRDDQRDPQLSALLRTTVDAPPLRPGFHEELEARLRSAGAPVTSVPARARRITTRRLVAAVTVAAAAALFAFAVLPALRGGDSATAADVLACMTAASDGAQTVRLRIVSESVVDSQKVSMKNIETTNLTMSIDGDTLATVTVEGSSKLKNEAQQTWSSSRTTGYDERLHEERSVVIRDTGGTRATIRRPAWQGDTSSVGADTATYAGLSASLRAQLAETDPDTPVEETTYLGRPAWHGIFTHKEDWGMDGEVPMVFRWDATVDQGTGLLVAASLSVKAKGKELPWVATLRVARMQLDPELDEAWQRPTVPARDVTVVDDGTRFGTPEEVAARSWPTLPLIPQWAPAGYRLTDVASGGSPSGGSQGHTVVVRRAGGVVYRRADWPLSDQIVRVRFRRGFSSFVVTISPKRLGEQLDGATDVTLTGGYLKGHQAIVTIDVRQLDGDTQAPTLTTMSDRSRVVISGDLTRQELIDVANSMKVYGDVDRPLLPGYENQ